MDTSSTRVSVTSSVSVSVSCSMCLRLSLGLDNDRSIWTQYGIECRNGRPGLMMPQSRVGRRRSTTPQHITDIAIDLFTTHGFAEVSVDDVAHAAGISRRTLFRYYAS